MKWNNPDTFWWILIGLGAIYLAAKNSPPHAPAAPEGTGSGGQNPNSNLISCSSPDADPVFCGFLSQSQGGG